MNRLALVIVLALLTANCAGRYVDPITRLQEQDKAACKGAPNVDQCMEQRMAYRRMLASQPGPADGLGPALQNAGAARSGVGAAAPAPAPVYAPPPPAFPQRTVCRPGLGGTVNCTTY
jgi:hypothetical protein